MSSHIVESVECDTILDRSSSWFGQELWPRSSLIALVISAIVVACVMTPSWKFMAILAAWCTMQKILPMVKGIHVPNDISNLQALIKLIFMGVGALVELWEKSSFKAQSTHTAWYRKLHCVMDSLFECFSEAWNFFLWHYFIIISGVCSFVATAAS